ncbi:nucleoside hydrolase [Brevibacillus agri]|uniref:nucleoside hydrolase n=1 Tax=Brevibacillus agri TaxID=51101 RepID=UPI0004706ADB|nr:nucleoside hydrolase [Brevibacillus agri]
MAQKQRLLIDYSGGLDQALALWYALQSANVQVSGIVVTDAEPQRGIRLAQKLIELVQPNATIPVVAGASRPLFHRETDAQAGAAATSDGVSFLSELRHDSANPYTLVTLGRLTTVAMAMARNHEWTSALERLVVRGGAIRVPGDVTSVAEANLHADPEAAAFVLAARLPLLFVPLDATESLSAAEAYIDELAKRAKAAGLVTAAEAEAFFSAEKTASAVHALAAIMAAESPECLFVEQMKLAVECQSELSRGALLADLRAKPSVGTDAAVCVGIKAGAVLAGLQQLPEKGDGRS